jgi:hypothetical protein
MEIQQLEKHSLAHPNVFITFQKLLDELRKRTLPTEVIEFINRELDIRLIRLRAWKKICPGR